MQSCSGRFNSYPWLVLTNIYTDDDFAIKPRRHLMLARGPLLKCGSYSFKFGELAGFLVDGNDDRYTFVEKLGKMFVFSQSELNSMLQLLSKVDMCHLIFYVGTARAKLTVTFAEIVTAVKPLWFVMVNVDRILARASGDNWRRRRKGVWYLCWTLVQIRI